MNTKIVTFRRFDVAQTRTLIKLYRDGFGLEYIASEFGASIQTVRRALVANGVTIRAQGRPKSS